MYVTGKLQERLYINGKFIIAFMLLRYLFHEAHEFSHMITAYTFTGFWGTRDFNNVAPFAAESNPSLLATICTALAGPFTNYIFCWIGSWLILKNESLRQRTWGILLIFAALPFARLFTAIMGGGDELGIVKHIIDNGLYARISTTGVLLLLLGYPEWIAIRHIPSRNRTLIGLGFLIFPMIIEGIFTMGIFNKILQTGILQQPHFFGAPALVLIVLAIVSVLLFVYRAHLTTFIRMPDEQKNKQNIKRIELTENA